jgi:hypothetical protein
MRVNLRGCGKHLGSGDCPLGPLMCFESFDEVEAAGVTQPQNPVAINAPMATVLSG